MPQTFSVLTQRVIKSVGEVEGTSVQTYSEPRVLESLTQIFNVLFRKYWWPQYKSWFQLTLDGTLGIITDSTFQTSVKDLRDIKAIVPAGRDRGIPLLPNDINPYNLTGTTPIYYEGFANDATNFARLFQIWPKTATGDLFVEARKLPTITTATINYLDDDLLVFGASWMILEAEDINPNHAALAERMFNETFADIMKHYSDQPIENPIRSVDRRYLTEWFSNP